MLAESFVIILTVPQDYIIVKNNNSDSKHTSIFLLIVLKLILFSLRTKHSTVRSQR